MENAMPDHFNDTIERMDFMIEQGRRLAASQSAKKPLAPSSLTQTPMASTLSPFRTPAAGLVTASTTKFSPYKQIVGRPIAPDSPVLKNKCINTPANMKSTTTSSTFKKPMPTKMFLTPGVQRKLTPNSMSRIPKPISAGKITNFDHVRSPIGAYISKTAPNPVRQNLNPSREFLDSTYCAKASKGLDYTLPNASILDDPKPRYPKTIYIQAKRNKVHTFDAFPAQKAYADSLSVFYVFIQIIDKRTNFLPGDQNVQRLVGSQPVVIISRGMISTYPPLNDDDGTFAEFAGEQFASFQIITGDQNVLEVYNGK